ALPVTRYLDAFGNVCTRLVAPAGELKISTDALIADSGLPDPLEPTAREHEIAELPHDTLVFLLGSRYCETERLMEAAWSRFGTTPPGWPRVQAICDFVHSHVRFGYQHARATRTAADVVVERRGVCRDFAHLAITLCRCMNIPARYCTGHLGDIGVAPEPEPMDFSAWVQVYLGGRWYARAPPPPQRSPPRPHGDGARARRGGRGVQHPLRSDRAHALRRAHRRGGAVPPRTRRAHGGLSQSLARLDLGPGLQRLFFHHHDR